jgi:hypothetical protein
MTLLLASASPLRNSQFRQDISIERFGVMNDVAIMHIIEIMPPHVCMRFDARKWRNIVRFCFTRSLLSFAPKCHFACCDNSLQSPSNQLQLWHCTLLNSLATTIKKIPKTFHQESVKVV